MSMSPSMEPTLEPTTFPTSQFMAHDYSTNKLISFTDWKLYMASGLFIILCVSLTCLIKCCKTKQYKINEASVNKTIQNSKFMDSNCINNIQPRAKVSTISQTNISINNSNDFRTGLDTETKNKYTNSNIHLMSNPSKSDNIILECNDNDSTDDSITFEPITRHSDAKKRQIKKYKLKQEKSDKNIIENVNVKNVNLSFDYDLNPILYTGMSVIKPQINNDMNGIAEGKREHSITESSTFTMKPHHGFIGINEGNVDFKMFTKDIDGNDNHTKLMEIQSECENIVCVDEHENKECKYNKRLTAGTEGTNCSGVRLPKKVTVQGYL